MKKRKGLLLSGAVLAALAGGAALADEVQPEVAEQTTQELVQQTETATETQAQEIAEVTEQPVQAQVIESENVTAEPAAEATETVETTVAQEEAAEPVAEVTKTENQNEIGTVDDIDVTAEKSDNNIKTWETAKGTVSFHVEEQAKAGDVTVIKFPKEISLTRIPSQGIELKTENDLHFADADFSSGDNTITIKYNDNVAGLQNIKGGFEFFYKLNLDIVKEVKDIELAFAVNNKQKIITKTLKYIGIGGEKNTPTFEKTSWQDGNDASRIKTSLTIGKDGSGYNNMIIEDDIAAESEDNATYDYSTFHVSVGKWVWSDVYGWIFNGTEDITSKIVWIDKQAGQFKIAIPEAYNGQQMNISYDLVYSKPVEKGETINNKAILKAGDKQVSEWNSRAVIFNLSGWINGDKVVQKVPNTYPTIDKPEIPLEFEVPNTYPTIEKPTLDIGIVPNTYPTVDKPELEIELPKTPTPKAEKPALELTTKAKHNAVIKEKAETKYADSNYQAKLPETGDKADRKTIIITALVVAGVVFATLWTDGKDK